MARSLPDINENSPPDTGVVQWTGQPYKNFEFCSYESGPRPTSEDYATAYWIRAACKTGSVDAASIIIAGRDLEIKISRVNSLRHAQSSHTTTRLRRWRLS